MRISARAYAVSLYQVLKEAPKQDHPQLIKSFLNRVFKNRDFRLMDKILEELDKYIDEVNKTLKVKVTSAHPLNKKIQQEIKEMIKKELDAKEVQLEEEVDSELIGGVVLHWGDYLVDGSVKNRLNKLKKSLVG